jgi:hypothetical protein
MSSTLRLLAAVFIFAIGFCIPAHAEDIQSDDEIPATEEEVPDRHEQAGRGRRVLVLNIDTRVLDTSAEEGEQTIVWNESHRRVAISGSPVAIKMVGSNIVVSLQFTPFIRRHGSVMVAQGQIWVDDPNSGLTYYTSIQTIPMELGEPIFFFPLGQSRHLESFLEIMLTVNLYSETILQTEGSSPNRP